MSKSGSSTHTGWPSRNGTSTSRRRKTGAWGMRAAICACILRERVPPGHGRRVEHRDHLHVHVERRGLEVEEAGVEPAQLLHATPPPSLGAWSRDRSSGPVLRRPTDGRRVPMCPSGPVGSSVRHRAGHAVVTARARTVFDGGVLWVFFAFSMVCAAARGERPSSRSGESRFTVVSFASAGSLVGELPGPGRHGRAWPAPCVFAVDGAPPRLGLVGWRSCSGSPRPGYGRPGRGGPPVAAALVDQALDDATGGPVRAEGFDLTPAWDHGVAAGHRRPVPLPGDPPDPQHRLRGATGIYRHRLDIIGRRRRPADGRTGARLHPRRGVDHRRQARAGHPDDARAGRAGLGLRGHQLPAQPQGHLARPRRRLQAGRSPGCASTSPSTAATPSSSRSRAARPAATCRPWWRSPPTQPEWQPGFEDADTSVDACVPFYGVYDMTGDPEPVGAYGPGLVDLLEKRVMKTDRARRPRGLRAGLPRPSVTPAAPPMFVVHGTNDTLVPVAGGPALRRAPPGRLDRPGRLRSSCPRPARLRRPGCPSGAGTPPSARSGSWRRSARGRRPDRWPRSGSVRPWTRAPSGPRAPDRIPRHPPPPVWTHSRVSDVESHMRVGRPRDQPASVVPSTEYKGEPCVQHHGRAHRPRRAWSWLVGLGGAACSSTNSSVDHDDRRPGRPRRRARPDPGQRLQRPHRHHRDHGPGRQRLHPGLGGLFKGALVGTEAYADYVNSTGGVNGRKIVVNSADDGSTGPATSRPPSRPSPDDFALVGDLLPRRQLRRRRSWPRTPGSPTSPWCSTPPPTSCPTSSAPSRSTTAGQDGSAPVLQEQVPGDTNAVGTLVADSPSAQTDWAGEKYALENVGYKFIYEPVLPGDPDRLHPLRHRHEERRGQDPLHRPDARAVTPRPW